MENYMLYFKLLNHPEPFNPITYIETEEEINTFDLLENANEKLKNVKVMLTLKGTDVNSNEITKKNLPFDIKKVETWLYLEKCESYIGISQVNTGTLVPIELNGIVLLKKENVD